MKPYILTHVFLNSGDNIYFALMVSPVLCSCSTSTVRKTMLKRKSVVSLVVACKQNRVHNLVSIETLQH